MLGAWIVTLGPIALPILGALAIAPRSGMRVTGSTSALPIRDDLAALPGAASRSRRGQTAQMPAAQRAPRSGREPWRSRALSLTRTRT